MQVTKKDLEKSQIELTVELPVEEFAPYIEKGAQKVSEEVKIEGFRPGKVPYEVLKQKIGEMTIIEEAAHIAIRKTIDDVIEKNTLERQAIGQPQVNITKLAPGNPLEYKIIVSLLPTIALGEYKNLGLKAEEAKVDDQEIEKALTDLRGMRAKETLAEREAKEGDKVTVSIKMFLDKVPVEGGEHQDLAVILGQNYFVPGFDDKLIGAKKDEVKKFSLSYPDDHHQKNLAGKMVDFEVAIKGVYQRELPELNDEFAGFFGAKNMEDFRKSLEETLLHEKGHSLEMKNESALLGKIVDNAKFGELPEAIVDSEAKNMMLELEQSVIRQGGKFEEYLQHLKKSRTELMLELAPNAIKRVKSALVIREIAIIEKITVTEKEVQDKIGELRKQYANNPEIKKMIEEPGYTHYLANILTNEKVIAKLKEWNYVPSGDKQKS